MTALAFNPEILQSPTSLARFLNGADDLRAIRSVTASTLSGRWEIDNWSDLKEGYHLFRAFLLTIASYLLHGLYCCRSLSKRIWVMSRHEKSAGTIFKTQKIFQENLLVTSVNAHRLDSTHFYLQPSIQVHLPGQSQEVQIDFFQDGLCRGMCHWFVFLFFQSSRQGLSPQDQMQAIGQQFTQGASYQAAFLQGVPEPRRLYDLLPLQLEECYLCIDPRGTTHEQIVNRIQQCPIGIYGLYAGNHQTLYINYGAEEKYLFDPNKGVLKVASPYLFKKAIERYLINHGHSQEIFLDRYTPRS